MGKTAFIFPGQGAQYVGMGKDFYHRYEEARKVYEIASKCGDLDVESLCFTENNRLDITEYTQIAMLATEVAILKVVESKGIKADICAGLSLGEYGALAAAGAMELTDLFRIIRKRGIFMQEAYPTGGAMCAVLGTDTALIEEICERTPGIVSIANYNCPGQIVITGEKTAVEEAAEGLKAAGAKRCIPLKVSGPFHSALLEEAGKELGKELEGANIHKPLIPYVCNLTASVVTDKAPIRDLLMRQISGPVRWQQSIERMIESGADTFIEIGPGKTLSGFMKKINSQVRTLNIETVADLEKVGEELSC